MLRRINELVDYSVREVDGKIGIVRDFLINREDWKITYMEIDLTDWYPGKKVIIPPSRINIPDSKRFEIPVSLTKAEVENSPALELDEEICRKHEEELALHFGWSPCFVNPGKSDVNLKSLKEMVGYNIHAIDGSIGYIEDFIIDDKDWVVRYVVVNTRNWLPGKRVLMSPNWITSIIWEENSVVVGHSQEAIKNSPEFDSETQINRQFEEVLYEYYGKPTYWD